MKSKQKEEWIKQAKLKGRLVVFYQQNVLDLTDFNSHPGGKKVIKNYIYKDVTQFLFTVYPHKKQTTLAILNKYIIGINSSYRAKPTTSSNTSISQHSKSKKKVCFSKTINNNVFRESRRLQVRSNVQKFQCKQGSSITLIQKSGKSCKKHGTKNGQVSIKLISHLNIEQSNRRAQEIDFNFQNQQINQFKDIANIPAMKTNFKKMAQRNQQR